MSFSVIVAADEANGIGKDGGLPWRLPGDMAFFKHTTAAAPEGKRNVVIMGRKTWDSIPAKFRPLEGRDNVVVTRSPVHRDPPPSFASSLDEAVRTWSTVESAHRIFVIGGGEIYREALQRPDCTEVLLTRVHARFECDTHLPPFTQAFARTHADGPYTEGDLSYTFETYTRRP